jgi:CRISPR-associated protein Cas2
MLMLVTYDVATMTAEGRRRLRRVARVCLNYGQRVQMSVFECSVGETQLVQLRHDLLKEVNLQEDSLRLYNLGENSVARVEHHGQRASVDFDDALIESSGRRETRAQRGPPSRTLHQDADRLVSF